MHKQACNIRSIVVGGRPLLVGHPSTVRSFGLLAHVASQSGLTMPSLSSNKIIHSGFRFLQSPHRGQTVFRFQSRSCNPINGPKKTPLNSRNINNDLNQDLKLTLFKAVFRSSNQATTAERFKDVIFCIRRFISWQCEGQASLRLQKGLKYYSRCSKIWKDESVMRIFGTLRRMLLTRSHLLISAVGVYSYDWENNKISDDAIKRSARDMEILEELFKRTITCSRCGKRQVIDYKIATITYCMCDGKLGYTNTSRTYDGWEPFIERDNVIVWRKPHEIHTHLWQFKVYGRYEDVSLSAFMESQLNTNFRTEWDFTALQLSILHSQKESNSDLLYWLVKYPSFFSNRDYLFKRRFHIDKESQEVTIMNEALGGNEVVPEVKGLVRVSEYWSTTVIRPLEKTSKTGMEYSLTYFDNPGTSLPRSVTNFIATTGFPNFLKQNHNAALTLQSRYENGEDAYVSLPYTLRYPDAVEIDVKISEEQLPLDQEQEILALQNVLENKIEITDLNKTVISAELEKHESDIQLHIEEKSDILQNETSQTVTIDKVDELEIMNNTNYTKESELVSGQNEIDLLPTIISVKDKEIFVKEEEIELIKGNLKENKLSNYNENESISEEILETSIINIEQDNVSESIVGIVIISDELKSGIVSKDDENKAPKYYENKSISDDSLGTPIINIEQKVLSKGIIETVIEPNEVTHNMELIDSIENNEYRNESKESIEYSEKENDKIVQNDENESLADMKIEVPIGSKKVVVGLLEALEVIAPKLEQETVKSAQIDKNEILPDTKIEVPIGSKKVVVDILEAMEVISPELEQKTVLLKKVEDWAEAALRDIDNNTEVIQNVKKLRAKIEKFKEHAKNKKIQSLKIMEEIEKKTNTQKESKPIKAFSRHYDHSGGLDEKTLVTLEKFLLNMKEIADSDRDMRTGRGYFIDSSENVEDSKQNILRKTTEKFLLNMKEIADNDRDMRTGRGYFIDSSENVENSKQNILRKTTSKGRNKETKEKNIYQEEIKHESTVSFIKSESVLIKNNSNQKATNANRVRVNEFDNDEIAEDEKNDSSKENDKEDPPRDPPSPTATKVEKTNEMSHLENIPTADTAQMSNNVNSDLISESGNKYFESSTNSWYYHYIPGMSYFGGGNNKVFAQGSVLSQSEQVKDKSSNNIDPQSSYWYTFGLYGYFSKTSKAQESDSSVSKKETENTNGCENVNSNGTSWYWYPIIGMHKAYGWVWNAGVKV